MDTKKIYIIFTDTGTLFTKLIKLYTKKSLNHVSVSFDDQLKEIYSFGRKKPYNPFIGGFVKEKIAEGLFKKASCAIYSFTISDWEYEQMQKKVRQMEAEKELYKYNLLGLFAIIFNYQLNRKYAFFCSQFVATILNEKMGVLDKPASLCKPQDLMRMKDLQLIYQGKLHLYPNQAKAGTEDNDLDFPFWKQKIYNSADFS